MSLEEKPQEGGGVPYLGPQILAHITWRADDVVVTCPPKCGTTWTLNIVHQLVHDGDQSFTCLYEVIHWLDYVEYKGQPAEERAQRLNSLPTDSPRVFKTHMPVDLVLPFHPSVRYVVVCRNPADALLSGYHFMSQHTDEFFAYWGCGFLKQVPLAMHLPLWDKMYYLFYKAWSAHLGDPQVLFVHFNDLKTDLPAQIRRIAAHLALHPSSQYSRTSLAIPTPAGPIPVLIDDAVFFNTGQIGSAAHDALVTDDVRAALSAMEQKYFADQPAFLNWMLSAQPLP